MLIQKQLEIKHATLITPITALINLKSEADTTNLTASEQKKSSSFHLSDQELKEIIPESTCKKRSDKKNAIFTES